MWLWLPTAMVHVRGYVSMRAHVCVCGCVYGVHLRLFMAQTVRRWCHMQVLALPAFSLKPQFIRQLLYLPFHFIILN